MYDSIHDYLGEVHRHPDCKTKLQQIRYGLPEKMVSRGPTSSTILISGPERREEATNEKYRREGDGYQIRGSKSIDQQEQGGICQDQDRLPME